MIERRIKEVKKEFADSGEQAIEQLDRIQSGTLAVSVRL